MTDQTKSFGAVKVGKNRYFWMAFRWSVWMEWLYTHDWRKDALDVDGIDGEGIATTMDEALAAARRAADAVPGPLGRRGMGQKCIRTRYRDAYARKKPPSANTTARPSIGSLWEDKYIDHDWGEIERGWYEWTITKQTAKRVFVIPVGRDLDGNTLYPGWTPEYRQRSLDRAKLEKDGSLWFNSGGWGTRLYTNAGKAAFEADERHSADKIAFPRLGLPQTATRAEVMTAFRRIAKTAHHDAGGDAVAFRELVAEKDTALRGR